MVVISPAHGGAVSPTRQSFIAVSDPCTPTATPAGGKVVTMTSQCRAVTHQPPCQSPTSLYTLVTLVTLVPLQHNARSNGPRMLSSQICTAAVMYVLRSTSQCRKVKFRERRNVIHWALTDAFPYYMIQRRGTNVTEQHPLSKKNLSLCTVGKNKL